MDTNMILIITHYKLYKNCDIPIFYNHKNVIIKHHMANRAP